MREEKLRMDPWFRVVQRYSRDPGEHQIGSLESWESENLDCVLIQSLEGLGYT